MGLIKSEMEKIAWIDVDNLTYLNYWIIGFCCLHNFTIDIPFAGINEQQFEDEDEEMEQNEDDRIKLEPN